MRPLLLVFLSVIIQGIHCQNCSRTIQQSNWCAKSCNTTRNDCKGNRDCVCDGDCGFSCVKRGMTCPRPRSIPNGRVIYKTTTLGSTLKYRCTSPAKLVGPKKRSCRGKGKWDGHEPTCRIRQCGALRIPSNAEILRGEIKSSYEYGEQILFKCKHGYFADGFNSQRCDLNGWSSSNFVCSPKSCGHPGNPINGKATSYKFTFLSKVSFQCDYGFKLNGDQYRLCQANQKWSGDMPTCEPIDCGELPPPFRAEKIMDTGTRMDGTVRFKCLAKGYEIHGSEIRTCQNDGTWSGVATTCKIVSCGDPGTPANGEQIVVKGNYNYGSSVEFKCKANYTMSGSARLYCEESKDWNASIPRCWAPCTDPGLPANGARIGNDFRHDKSVTFSCHEDFTLKGEKSIRCRDGRWSADKPTCQVIKCKDPGSPDHGRQVEVINSYSYPGTVRFECLPSHSMMGTPVINCMKNGQWDPPIPSCFASCRDPGNPLNGLRIGDRFTHSSVVKFKCLEDFLLRGTPAVKCNDGHWNGTTPTCQGCVDGFALGMKDGRIKDSSITASSDQDPLHAAHYGRLGGNTYWCSKMEKESFLEINLSKRYKITAMKIQLRHKYGIRLLEFRSKYFDSWTPFDKSVVESTLVHKRFTPLIAQSLRVVVESAPYKLNRVCLSAEVYGCAAPSACIMKGSMVVGKQNDNYRRAYVRAIHGDRFEVISEGGSYTIFQRKRVVLDEVPSASQLTYGATVLGVDTSSRKIRKGELHQKDDSLWQIVTDTSTWKSQEKDIRLIKEAKYCHV